MIRGSELEEQVFDQEHIRHVLAEIKQTFMSYFETFAKEDLNLMFQDRIEEYEKEQEKYREYLDLESLDEFEYDPNAFKGHTRKGCPIILRCLMSQDDVMKSYKRSFGLVTGRKLLDAVRNIAKFGLAYTQSFDDNTHEHIADHKKMELEPLNDEEYYTGGVIGYGIQSSLLFGLHPREFAHRSQNAVWALYFLSNSKDFGLLDGSEFLMIHESEGTCEQNYLYPAELFGFYSLKLYLMLNSACNKIGITFDDQYRYIYLSVFSNHVASTHRNDINTYTRSSTHVESQPWFG
jgi:hypothetical protein